jgi:hypothetical protein
MTRERHALSERSYSNISVNLYELKELLEIEGGDYILLFPDRRKAIGTFQELIVNVKEATSAELLMAFCDLDELLID